VSELTAWLSQLSQEVAQFLKIELSIHVNDKQKSQYQWHIHNELLFMAPKAR
jgi:hypothetical protein